MLSSPRIIAVKSPISRRVSATLFPATASVIIDADDWLIEHPDPEYAISSRVPPSSATSTVTSSPQSGFRPSWEAEGAVRWPLCRGLR